MTKIPSQHCNST